MARSKIIINGETYIDLTTDTVSTTDVANGKTFHLANGTQATGLLSFVTYYTGTSEPSSNLGNDGDIYLKVVN